MNNEKMHKQTFVGLSKNSFMELFFLYMWDLNL